MHEEVAVQKNKRRRKKLVFLLVLPLAVVGTWFGLRGLDANFMSSGSRYVTLGQVSFEKIEESLQQSPHYLLVLNPKGKVLDTIYSLKDYQKLFFEVGKHEEMASLSHYTAQDLPNEGLDPLVVLGDVSKVSLEEDPSIQVPSPSSEPVSVEKLSKQTQSPAPKLAQRGKEDLASQTERKVSNVSKLKDDSVLTHESRSIPSNALPEFPGGMNRLTQYLSKHTQYPPEAARNNIKGIVYVSFLVDEYGKVTSPKIIRGLEGGCDEEVLRLLSTMPHWRAARYKGEAIEMSYTLSVPFPPQ